MQSKQLLILMKLGWFLSVLWRSKYLDSERRPVSLRTSGVLLTSETLPEENSQLLSLFRLFIISPLD